MVDVFAEISQQNTYFRLPKKSSYNLEMYPLVFVYQKV